MRVFAVLLQLLTLLMVAAAGGLAAYNWLTFNREINQLQRADDQTAQRHKGELQRLMRQMQDGDAAQAKQLEQSLQQVVQRLDEVELRDDASSPKLLTNALLASIAAAERAAYLGQPLPVVDGLLSTAFVLIEQLPATAALSLQAAIERDHSRLEARPVQDLANIVSQMDAIQRQIVQLIQQQPVRQEPVPEPVQSDEDADWWDWLLDKLQGSFRLERVEVKRTAPPSRQEYDLIRAALSSHLAQARLGLLMRDQAVWDSAWQNLLVDAGRMLAEDKRLQMQQQIVRIAAIRIAYQPFQFSESRQILEAQRQ